MTDLVGETADFVDPQIAIQAAADRRKGEQPPGRPALIRTSSRRSQWQKRPQRRVESCQPVGQQHRRTQPGRPFTIEWSEQQSRRRRHPWRTEHSQRTAQPGRSEHTQQPEPPWWSLFRKRPGRTSQRGALVAAVLPRALVAVAAMKTLAPAVGTVAPQRIGARALRPVIATVARRNPEAHARSTRPTPE